jgi:hypothetical protein
MKTLIENNFKIGEFVAYETYSEWGWKDDLVWGEIVDIQDDFAFIVKDGIDLNRTNHFRPNFMKPIRTRPIKDTDTIRKVKIDRLNDVSNAFMKYYWTMR